jgi:hypothetical protein
MITVPCCGPCNTEKKQVDDFLRDYLVAIIDEHRSETAEAIKTGSLQRAVNRGQSKLHKELEAITRMMALPGVRRPDLEPIILIPLRKYVRYAVQGVFYARAEMRIPNGHKIMMFKIDGLDAFREFRNSLSENGPVNGVVIGDQSVFGSICQSITSSGSLNVTIWALIFYERTFIGCMTAAPTITERLPKNIQDDFV